MTEVITENVGISRLDAAESARSQARESAEAAASAQALRLVESYIRSRDPGSPAPPGTAESLERSLRTLRSLPANEWSRACREIFLAALESYSAESLHAVDDVVGGWLATAEVWTDPGLASELAAAMGRTLEVVTTWNSGSSRIVEHIESRTRSAGSPVTVSVSLRG
ncbi:MAG: hypothetical protein ACE5R4_09485 [Armatimonadota bacterium]